MSFEINWDKLQEDTRINQSIKDFFNDHLRSISLPSYVNNVQVTNFSLGNIPPHITLKQIDDPLEEFYDYISKESNEKIESTSDEIEHDPQCPIVMDGKQNDIQFLVEIDYKGDMLIEVGAELVLNYPSPTFMTLPVKLSISDIGMHSLCLIAYLSKQLFISFLCDVSDPILDNSESILDTNGPNFMSKRSLERISLIRSIKIQSEIGEYKDGEGSTLRSVGKLEQFLVEIFRNALRKEAAWPSWINLDFDDDVDDDDDDDDGEDDEEENGEDYSQENNG